MGEVAQRERELARRGPSLLDRLSSEQDGPPLHPDGGAEKGGDVLYAAEDEHNEDDGAGASHDMRKRASKIRRPGPRQ